MSGFIDINRLDYVDPEQIHIPEEFSELQQIHASCNKQVVTFLIKNSLKKQKSRQFPAAFIVFRISFRDSWEWHLPSGISQILDQIKKLPCITASGKWDCMWILKRAGKRRSPFYFCDIVIIMPDNGLHQILQEHIIRQFKCSSIVAEIKILNRKNISAAELTNICLPDDTVNILKCEFAHDIPVRSVTGKKILNAVSTGSQHPDQAVKSSFQDILPSHNPEIQTDQPDFL